MRAIENIKHLNRFSRNRMCLFLVFGCDEAAKSQIPGVIWAGQR